MPAPKHRRARGTGAIFWSASRQLWIGRVPTGGKTAGGFTKYQELSDKSQSKLIERLDGLAAPGPGTTVRQWSAKWIETSTVRPSTRARYQYTLKNFILPTLGHFRVAALTTHHCERAVTQWLQRVARSTARVYLGQLRNMLNAARRAGLCQSNPARDVPTPKAPRRRIVPLPAADLERIIRASLVKPADWPVALLASTGCRVGEALALDVEDWDATAGTIAITRTWTRQHGMRPPKSDHGVRTIRVPEVARPALVRAAGGRDSGPLFCVWDQRNRRYHESVRQAFKAILERLGIGHCNLHRLRHSIISNMIGNGAELADVARYAGDCVGTIISTYLHPVAADPSLVMDRLFSSGRDGTRKRG